jgi:hypothetical protein
MLRQPGKEFTLIKENNGRWNFKPVSYQKHKVAGLTHPTSSWVVNNEFDQQPVKLRIETLMSVKSYNDPSNVVLADFAHPEMFTAEGNAEGVAGGIAKSGERPAGGVTAGQFFAGVSGLTPKEGFWIKMERKFDPWLDISKNQALGVWVKGDGNGQLLNFRIESPSHLSHGARGDHFIKIDFTGWKYFELVEIESSEFSNYIWPDSGFYVYDSYRHTVQFNNVDKLQVWYNNLPAGKEVRCEISNVKALPMVPVTVTNPAITIGDRKLTFNAKIESGMYLEFYSADNCKLYGPKGEFIQDVKLSGEVPVLGKGENNISFSCDGTYEVNPRVQLTVINEGDPIDNQ